MSEKPWIVVLFITALKTLPFVEQIWLFGSRARGNHQEKSDINLAIVCSDYSSKNWAEVTKIIDNADTLLDIDCVQFNREFIGSEFYDNIAKDKRLVYMKEIACKDRFTSLGKALASLSKVVKEPDFDQNEYMRDAAIQRFEFTIELFWKVLQKVLQHEKNRNTTTT